jgi:hypothetical protein
LAGNRFSAHVLGTTNAWYPIYGHPGGPDPLPEFVAVDGLVFPTRHRHLADPWFMIVGGLAYPTEHHPMRGSNHPWFEIVGSMIYAAKGHPDGHQAAPWYQAR